LFLADGHIDDSEQQQLDELTNVIAVIEEELDRREAGRKLSKTRKEETITEDDKAEAKDSTNDSKIVPIYIRYLQYTDNCGDTHTQIELISAGEYGALGINLNLATMRVRFETWQLGLQRNLTRSNVSNNIPPLPPSDIALLNSLINRYNSGAIQSNCQSRGVSDVDGWSHQKMRIRTANGPWWVYSQSNVSVPPMLSINFPISGVNMTDNTLTNATLIVIQNLITTNILPTFRTCGDLPFSISINLPSLDSSGNAIPVATQNTIGSNIQAQLINDMNAANIPTTGISFIINTNAVTFPSIFITSP
jgi:hypothetical protein